MEIPKLRFKADDGSDFPDWEKMTLGDVGSVAMCKRVFKEQTREVGDVPFFKIGTFGGVPDAYISNILTTTGAVSSSMTGVCFLSVPLR